MDITFTGTGSGKVSLQRDFSSLIFTAGGYNLLVDAGDGISKTLLKQSIPYNSIDGVLITHFHPDHFTGLPTLIIQMKMSRREKPLDIFIDEQLVKNLQMFLEISYVFSERMDFDLKIKPLKPEVYQVINTSMSILARQNSHLAKYEYLTSFKNIPVSSLGVLIVSENKKVFYTGDCSNESDLYLFSDHLMNIVIAEGSHIKPEVIKEFALNHRIPMVYLTHLDDSKARIDEDEKFKYSYDGMKVVI